MLDLTSGISGSQFSLRYYLLVGEIIIFSCKTLSRIFARSLILLLFLQFCPTSNIEAEKDTRSLWILDAKLRQINNTRLHVPVSSAKQQQQRRVLLILLLYDICFVILSTFWLLSLILLCLFVDDCLFSLLPSHRNTSTRILHTQKKCPS